MNETKEILLRHYLTCLSSKDLEGCLACFNDESVIQIRDKQHAGKKAIADWHAERFAANFRARELDNFRLAGDDASIDFKMSSDKLAGRRMEELPATLHATTDGAQFSRAQIKVRLGAGLMNLFGF